MAPLIRRLRDHLAARAARIRVRDGAPVDVPALVARTGLVLGGRAEPEVILGSDVGLELGHPRTASRAFVLTSAADGLIESGRISCLGPDLDEMRPGAVTPFGQVVLLQVSATDPPDPFRLETLQHLTSRLPGHMARSLPGRLWLRISRRALAGGMTLWRLGEALIAAYLSEVAGVTAAEIVLVTSNATDVEALEPLAREAQALLSLHKRLTLSAGGQLECPDLDCERCEDRPVCDSLREVTIKGRRRPATAGAPAVGTAGAPTVESHAD